MRLIELIQGAVRALRERYDRSPIDSVEALVKFVHTRSAFISQTTLHGYLKARMGTQFQRFFEDETFARSIRIGAIKLFVSSAGDLAVFSAAKVAADRALAPAEAEGLARHCFREALCRCLDADDMEHVPEGALDAFDARVAATIWANAALGEAAFEGSARDLLRYAPVVDEFKARDSEIVRNSIRFRWRDVREQLQTRLVAAEVRADLRAKAVEGGPVPGAA